MYMSFYILYSASCILYSLFCILCSLFCILYSVFCILRSVFCILYSVLYVVSFIYMSFSAQPFQWPSLPIFMGGVGSEYVITINVYMARDVMNLIRATSITRTIGRGGPWKSILFWALKWHSRGPKRTRFSGLHVKISFFAVLDLGPPLLAVLLESGLYKG